MKGTFIVFEGIDGSGKTTQIKELSKWLNHTDLIPEHNQLVITREPGGTNIGQSIRSLLLDTSLEKDRLINYQSQLYTEAQDLEI